VSTTIGQGSKLRIDWKADWDRETLASVEAQRAVDQACKAAVAAAKTLAPVGDGDYRDSIGSIVEKVEGIWQGAVGATDFKANWIERGAVSPKYVTPARHPIQRGVEAQGIKVTSGA
jgi:hypothetical protein